MATGEGDVREAKEEASGRPLSLRAAVHQERSSSETMSGYSNYGIYGRTSMGRQARERERGRERERATRKPEVPFLATKDEGGIASEHTRSNCFYTLLVVFF